MITPALAPVGYIRTRIAGGVPAPNLGRRFDETSKERGMETTRAPADRLIDEQVLLTEALRPSFSTSRSINRLAGYTGDLLGASSWIWRFKHNYLHHGNTNVVGIDADIDQVPFARLAPDQTWRQWHRYQHVYTWGLYGFLTLEWLLISDFVT
jgi:Fatty acid desaturase